MIPGRFYSAGSPIIFVGNLCGWPVLMSSYSPLSSKTCFHKTGIPIAAVDISPYRTHAILAGRDILKTIHVHRSTCSEDFNLRSTIIAYASTHHTSRDAVSAQHKDHLGANDVKWSHGEYDTTIATAAANGRIVLYDLNHAGVEKARLHEHARQVHRVAFNPHQGAYLLSGSQDATIRLWDIRLVAGDRSVMTCGSTKKFQGNNEGIRDLRWSPTDGVEFAAGTDNGTIQRWDTRKMTAPLLKLSAHDKTCHSIDWHPSGRYLASAGADKNVKVWDFSSIERRMKPSWLLRAPQSVLNARWRPMSNTSVDGSPVQSTYLATSYDQNDPRIHIWDFRRPHVPFQEIDRYDSPTSDYLWHSEDRLWSVGVAGMFTQVDMNFATKPLERQNVNAVTVAPDSQMCFFSEYRPRRRLSMMGAPADLLHRNDTGDSSGERLSGSHSATDGSYEEEPSILNSSLRRRRHKSAIARSSENTPPSGHGNISSGKLDEMMRGYPIYQTTQIAAYGHVLGVFDAEVFEYLARYYEPLLLHKDLPQRCDVHVKLHEIFETNALLAAQAGQYRLGQTWRILGEVVYKELKERAEQALHRRVSEVTDETRRSEFAKNTQNRSMLENIQQEILIERNPFTLSVESASEMTTPLAKPTSGFLNVPQDAELLLSPKNGALSSGLNLGYSERDHALRNHAPNSRRGSLSELSISLAMESSDNLQDFGDSEDLQFGNSNLGTFADIDSQMYDRRNAMNDYRAKPRPVLRLDEPMDIPRRASLIPRLDRHDSGESFQMFSASTDSSHRALSTIGSFGENQRSDHLHFPIDSWQQKLRRNSSSKQNDNSNRFISTNDSSNIDQLDLPRSESLRQETENASPLKASHPSPCRPIDPKPPLIHLNPSLRLAPEQNSTVAETPTCHHDFLSVDFNPPASLPANPKPWSATTLIPAIIEFHLESLSDIQFPTFLIMYLLPFYPNLFSDQQVISTLMGYHEQLNSLSLFIQATELRKVCYPKYPEIYELTISKTQVATFFCMNCRKPVKGDTAGYCKRCRQPWGDCPVCETLGTPFHPSDHLTTDRFGYDLDYPEGADALWTWCQECGHGGHLGCLKYWWSDPDTSEGACPVQGCLCDCVPGKRRDQREAASEEQKRKAKVAGGGSVIRDGWVVGESKAVEMTRGVLSSGGGPIRTLSGRSGLLNAGLGGNKKVRLVLPDSSAEMVAADGIGFMNFDELEEETSRSVP